MVAAIAALISAGVGVGGLALNASRGGQQPQQVYDQNSNALLDSQNNQNYVRALNALGIQQSRAGFTDAQGGSIQYDPATNQWITTASPGQAAAAKSQQDATVKRNTTDMLMADRVNTRADARALEADRAVGPALAAIEQYQPITGSQLAGLLTDRATQGNAETFRPIVQDAAANATRTGTNAGDILSRLGIAQAGENRKAILDSQIAGYTGAADINKSNMDRLRGTYSTLAGRADPTLQFPGIAADDSNKTLAAIAADRAKTASGITTGAGYVSNQSQGLSNAASNQVAGSIPGNNILPNTLKGLGDIIGTPGFGKALSSLFGPDKKTASGFDAGTLSDLQRTGSQAGDAITDEFSRAF